MARAIEVKIIGDASSLQKAFGSAGSAADGFGSRLAGKVSTGLKILGGAALGAAGIIAGGFAAALKTGFGEIQEADAQLATSATLIKNLGSATKITTADIDNWAGALQNVTGIQDDVIMSAENVLLKFDALASDSGAFKRATTLAADMSVALGKTMPEAAQALGRALADPETAMGKLARMGVVLNEEQQRTIDKFIETGNQAGALDYLLGLLETKFGGVAEAAGDTTSGKVEILKRKFEDMSEALAEKLMPFADRFIDWLGRIMDAGSVSGALGEIASGIGNVAKELGSGIASFIGDQDWGHIGTVIVDKVRTVIEAIPWGEIVKGVGRLLWGALSTAFSAGVELLNDAGVGQAIRNYFEQQFEDALDVLIPITDKFLGGIQAMLEGLGRIPDALGGAKFDKWAEDVGDAREKLRAWNDELDEAVVRIEDVGDGFVSFEKVAQHAFDIDGIKGLATHLAAIDVPLDAATVATVAWAEAFDDVPDITQVQAILQDDEARAAIDAYIKRIGDIPEDSKTRAELLAQAAIELADDLKAAIERVPDSHDTQVTIPGAEDSKDKADRVAGSVRGIPDSSRTHVRVDGAENAVAAADRVAAHIRSIPTSWGTTITVTTVGGDLPVGTAGGVNTNARGSRNYQGGWSIVGEKGPEIVNLPKGTDIYSHSESKRMLGDFATLTPGGRGCGDLIVNVHVGGSVMAERDLARSIRDEILSSISQVNTRTW